MSHILDAIRRAEQQRQEDTVPSLEAMVQERRNQSRGVGRGWLVWPLLAVVVVASWYLNRERISAAVDWGPGSWYRQVTSGLFGEEESAPSAAADSAAAGASGGNDDATDAPALTNAQRQLLQQIRFAVISYSTDPDKRFAMVGSDTLREGDLLEGYPITRIRRDGVMLDVNGRAVLIRP